MRYLILLFFIVIARPSSAQKLPEHDTRRDDTFITVENMPVFPGGNDSLTAYIRNHLKYPEKAMENGIEGKVLVGFVVDKSGLVRDVEVKRSADPLLDAEALRIVKSFPKWQPGMQDGKTVNVSYVLPFNFKLNP